MTSEDPQRQDTRSQSNWHEDAFFGIHYDQHAKADDTVLGKDLTVEHLVERLSRVKPDWVQCDCKGHPGYTSWPTEVGSTSPGVVNDSLGMYREATRQMGIPLGMHYSGVWDSRAIELHPDWARIDERGKPDRNMTCRMSGYDEQLMIPQMLEIIDKYDVDGFWVDGENWASKPCYCDRCKAEFTRRTGNAQIPVAPDQPHWDWWLAFHRDLFTEHVIQCANAVHARKPGCLVCSNWMYTVRQPEAIKAPVDYLSGDFTWAWGADRAALEGRLLDGRNKSWDLMAWGFTKTGELRGQMPWTMKPVLHLCQEVSEVLALGGSVMVYNTPQRTGWLTDWQQDVIAEVATYCRAREDVCFRTRTVPEAAVLHLASSYYAHNDPLYNYGDAIQPVEGALHALLETHRSTDILTEDAALERAAEYKLVLLPEQTRLSDEMQRTIESYVRGGGCVLLSGAHQSRDYPELVGASPHGEAMADTVYLPVGNRAVGVFGPWQPVSPAPDTEVWTHWLSQQQPDKNSTVNPAVTMRRLGQGKIVTIHGPVFRNYFRGHYLLLREFLDAVVERLGIEWTATLEAPPSLELVLRQKEGKLFVNLINRGAGEALSPNRVIVDELPPVRDVRVRVRCDHQPSSVTTVPTNAPMHWSYEQGVLTVALPRVDVHSVITIG